MTLTKDLIIDSIYQNTDVNKTQSVQTFETTLEIIKSTLESGEDILISGFGKLCVKEKKERKGRNPATGKGLMLGARRVVTFKCSGLLRDKINAAR